MQTIRQADTKTGTQTDTTQNSNRRKVRQTDIHTESQTYRKHKSIDRLTEERTNGQAVRETSQLPIHNFYASKIQ